MMYKNLLAAIGNTPLVKIDLGTPAQLYAKLEYLNPSGSVKDRPAIYLIEQAEKNGQLKPGGTIIDASSGNQGIATAMIGAAKGYKVIITVSEKISIEKLQTLKAYGAEVVMCPGTNLIEDPNSYHSQAVSIHKKTPNSCMPNQYFNVENAKAMYLSLGKEIWEQTNGTVTHFFAGAGTGGTVSGGGLYIKEKNPNAKVFAIDTINSWYNTKGNPKPYKIEGIGIDFESPVLNHSILDKILPISDEQGFSMCKKLAVKHGVLAGPSSGAVAYAAAEYSKNLSKDDVVVMIFGDSGRAYLSKNLYANSETKYINDDIKIKREKIEKGLV
ncbi:cysteine synthase family protein [bacterium]|jgi:cystathionine beta-synthase|nr:cysteine synthase family protein [bacterium]